MYGQTTKIHPKIDIIESMPRVVGIYISSEDKIGEWVKERDRNRDKKK